MLSRRACVSVRSVLSAPHATPASSRSFAAGAALQSSTRPSTLADISTRDAASFIKKQKEFREGLMAAQKQKEQEEKESCVRDVESGKKKSGALSSLIYGTSEGRELDEDVERSFSQVLARGKYIHSIVFHDVKPDKVEEYTELIDKSYPKMGAVPENKVHLVGSWRTEVGDCNTFVHIWEYQRYESYHDSQHNIQHHPEFSKFDAKLKTLI